MPKGEKRYKVIVSSEAAQMLVSHARFLAQVSLEAAENLIDEYSEKVKSLELLPDRNPWVSDPMMPHGHYRKLLLAKRYLILYKVLDVEVRVEAVVDCRQNYAWLL